MRVIAFDPGKLTGIYEVNGANHWWAQYDFANLCYFLHTTNCEDTVFVVEKYVIMPRSMSTSTFALEAIGAIKFVAEVESVKVVMQKPSDAKNMMDDDTLRLHHWYNRKCNDHARDAQRHAALYLLGESNDGTLPVPATREDTGRGKTRVLLPVQRVDHHEERNIPYS